MHNKFNSIQESTVEMTLTGLQQEKYIQLFTKKGVTKFDTFVNMNEEDLLLVGITDDNDRLNILEGIKPLKQLYKDINECKPPDLDLIIGNNVHQLRAILGSLIIMRRKIVKTKPKNTLLDNTHSSTNALITLLDVHKSQLDYIEDDITFKEISKNQDRKRKGFLYFGLLASSFAVIAFSFTRYFGMNPLYKLNTKFLRF